MNELLLDGSLMEAKEFYRLYDEYVGMPHNEWEKLSTTRFYGDDEIYEYSDNKFVLGGSAYSAPKLFKLTNK